ncbi:MAG: 1-acyl-sn-glycerol-3-phosphate acyltransferase [Gammaproteobacteria bacterium]|nr:1-acyl-sn-glycerol-3-phosphate acyltransferase [Gammaproteobacteria bacterium]MCW5582450.1 1-acyl-sn-glycerol-3-phosphate acyltransferase [Gammaproteobacteria bacterium]
MIAKILRFTFFAIIVRFIVLIVIGLNIRHRDKLPIKGPAIIAANHNSHLDTLVLISLFQLKYLPLVHPVAAADYFLKNKWMAWFSQNIIGIIPIVRQGGKRTEDPLMPCYKALDEGQILIIFPEGTRGEPEQLSEFKRGIAHLSEHYPDVPVIPMFMHGLGKALPKGDFLLVPFFCDIFIGDPLFWCDDKNVFMENLKSSFAQLIAEGNFNQVDVQK